MGWQSFYEAISLLIHLSFFNLSPPHIKYVMYVCDVPRFNVNHLTKLKDFVISGRKITVHHNLCRRSGHHVCW